MEVIIMSNWPGVVVLQRPFVHGDVGYDLMARTRTVLEIGQTHRVGTGVIFLLEEDAPIYPEIKERSGLASKGIFVHGGVVDRGYRGEVEVILHNSTEYPYVVSVGDRIAQVIFRPVVMPEIAVRLDAFTPTVRGADGFGSTGQ